MTVTMYTTQVRTCSWSTIAILATCVTVVVSCTDDADDHGSSVSGSGGGAVTGSGGGAVTGSGGGGGAVTGGGGNNAGACIMDMDCDDGSSCTTDTCVANVCVHAAAGVCSWPAETTANATNLTPVGGNDFGQDLSGAVWNPASRTLWLCRNGGPSKVWALVEDGAGGYQIDTAGGAMAEWSDFGDAEAVAQVDFSEPNIVYVLDEKAGAISEFDLSMGGVKVEQSHWDLSAELGGSGAEGMTFVPDAFLTAQGFVDQNGDPYVSTMGSGGLMFVGHQSQGELYVYDLNRADSTSLFVGRYETGGDETAGLEFDRSTGQLMLWHDAGIDQLEIVSLSSTLQGNERKMDTIVTYDSPSPQNENLEGIAVQPIQDCVAGHRNLFMTIDDGGGMSLFLFSDYPC